EDWMKNYPLVGRELEMTELRSYTARVRFSNSPVISVWGIAGIGKSALVRNLYYDRMLNSNQFNKYSWVDVSHPFNLRDFSRSLLLDHHSEKDPIKECRELLSENQCLVVIDDLQSKEEWDLIQSALVSRPSSSVIIVITTEASVATYCTNNEGHVFNVKGLEAVAPMDLFRTEVCFSYKLYYVAFLCFLRELQYLASSLDACCHKHTTSCMGLLCPPSL
uniref:NB-ARC domain-containing protein n=1 Tax=Aegilops tauschii subsp. strangulata TaxID=200361 RepID=A0A453SXB5_AEGTS